MNRSSLIVPRPSPGERRIVGKRPPALHPAPEGAWPTAVRAGVAAALLALAGCTSTPRTPPPTAPTPPTPTATAPPAPSPAPVPAVPFPPEEAPTMPPPGPELLAALAEDEVRPLPPPRQQGRSQWVPVRWSSLPGLLADPLHQAWNAWVRSCERPGPTWAATCRDMRPLALGSRDEQLTWMVATLQPHRVASPDGSAPDGLLTGYFEPVMAASRTRTASHTVPLYALPARLPQGTPWFSRQAMDTDPVALAALQGREIAWLADPIDALILQIQGSGRVVMAEADGRERTVRLAFAGHNGHGYKSVGRWLLDRRAITDPSWPAIKAWAAANPERVNDMLWSNPRTVFFREEALSALDANFGPRGAQNVPLTPGRSIAVDPSSIPYGTPVWLATPGPTRLQRLVLAQDTGAAIVGAVRADYFAGWGPEAGQLAGGLKQPLQLWALWPRARP